MDDTLDGEPKLQAGIKMFIIPMMVGNIDPEIGMDMLKRAQELINEACASIEEQFNKLIIDAGGTVKPITDFVIIQSLELVIESIKRGEHEGSGHFDEPRMN